MACRGSLLALTDADVSELVSLTADGAAMMEFINGTLYIRCMNEWSVDLDKSWDAIHRCLTNGQMQPDVTNPRGMCILGAQEIEPSDEWIVGLCFPENVQSVHEAIGNLGREWLSERYWNLPKEEYGVYMSEEDFEHTWDYFQAAKNSTGELQRQTVILFSSRISKAHG
ncbi:MAG: DUF1877 family protein [Prosthecobacter sp.]